MTETQVLEEILHEVRERTGLDFAGHRRGTLLRRVRNRMTTVASESLPGYLALLRATPAEAAALVDRLTIKVSRFYRNAPAFDLLRGAILPGLARGPRPLAAWSAGCGCGEEAYTLAMLLAERGAPGEVVATDLDAGALEAARAGVYREEALAELPPELRARFLEPGERPGLWRVGAEARSRVRFQAGDLCGDPPGGRFDLVCCRNVLIYLDPQAQRRAYARMDQALAPGGFLMLGEAEWPAEPFAARLKPVAHRARLFEAAAPAAAAA